MEGQDDRPPLPFLKRCCERERFLQYLAVLPDIAGRLRDACLEESENLIQLAASDQLESIVSVPRWVSQAIVAAAPPADVMRISLLSKAKGLAQAEDVNALIEVMIPSFA